MPVSNWDIEIEIKRDCGNPCFHSLFVLEKLTANGKRLTANG
jgi:hypothetical protein